MLLDNFIFLPDALVPAPPSGIEERRITAEDGVQLHAWYAPAAPTASGVGAVPLLVWSHGNAGNVANRVEVMLALQARGLSVLAYDYRGYGRSQGRPSEAGVYRDARAAYDSALRWGTPPDRIVGFGESLGSAVTLRLATERPCARVALVAPFTTLADVACRHYGVLGRLAGTRFDALASVRRLAVPVLVAHGDRDEIVPFELGQRLFAAAPEPKRFVRVRGAHHNDVLDDPSLLDAIAAFAHEVVRAP
jgi:hypothetical protein